MHTLFLSNFKLSAKNNIVFSKPDASPAIAGDAFFAVHLISVIDPAASKLVPSGHTVIEFFNILELILAKVEIIHCHNKLCQ